MRGSARWTLAVVALVILAGVILYEPGAGEEPPTPTNFSLTVSPEDRFFDVDKGDEIDFEITCASHDAPARLQISWMEFHHDTPSEATREGSTETADQRSQTLTVAFDEPGYHEVRLLCSHVYSDWVGTMFWRVHVGY